MKKKLAVLGLCTILLAGCGKIPTLKNGEEAVVTFENGDKISVDQLYDAIKKDLGLTSLINLIDTYVLEKTFPKYIDTAEERADAYLKSAIQVYGVDGTTLANQYGFSTEEALKDYFYLSYMQQHAEEEYSKTLIKDDEIEKYYDDEIVGDIEVSHILITPETTDSMTDEEVSNAEKAAEDKAKEILNELKKADDLEEAWKKAVKDNTMDDATKSKDGSLGKINKATLGDDYKELVDAAYKTKDGALYGSVVKTELGFHIIYKTKSYDKASLKDSRDSIIETLATDLRNDDSTIYMQALQHYRNELGLEVIDEDLKAQYAAYVQNGLTQNDTTN